MTSYTAFLHSEQTGMYSRVYSLEFTPTEFVTFTGYGRERCQFAEYQGFLFSASLFGVNETMWQKWRAGPYGGTPLTRESTLSESDLALLRRYTT